MQSTAPRRQCPSRCRAARRTPGAATKRRGWHPASRCATIRTLCSLALCSEEEYRSTSAATEHRGPIEWLRRADRLSCVPEYPATTRLSRAAKVAPCSAWAQAAEEEKYSELSP